ncbi:MAG TPA: 30S ribosomal protein S17 [Candidatus Udaeobacter sp.]|nr:30S ribosomal protein S17 [Candidatus Udaeobacter sp.]
METKQPSLNKRKFEGEVVSVAMSKTVVVRVETLKMNSKYGKSYKVSSRYPVHDEKGEAKLGDKVVFVESRPISKTKKWRLVEVIKK